MGYTVPDDIAGDVLLEIYGERVRQDRLKAEGRFEFTCADSLPLGDKLAILMEEVGEVARCVVESRGLASDRHDRDLRKELVQVAAVCAAWAESLI